LHTVEEEDLDFLQRGVNDRRVWRPIGRPRPVTGPEEREFFEEVIVGGDGVHLLVCVEGERVGIVSLTDPDRSAEVGYWIAPESHEQGYGSAAVGRLVEYGFDQLGLHRVEARVFDFNEASQALLRSLGFTHEGTFRETGIVDGDYRDTLWFGLLEDEWRSGESSV
ncbi:MAG: GNAT family N-acetyltransferase, partial [Halobaculum sp.]